ncbi:MAG: glycosyltransferase family 4 protein, partial [Blastocatellia bacterium]
FPILLRRRAIIAAESGKPYDLINVHEPSAAAICMSKSVAGNPVVVVTTYGVEQRGWELSLEELRLGRHGPTLKSRVSYPLTSLWQSRIGLRRADHILCKNLEDRDYLIRRLKIPEANITHFCPGADLIYASNAARRDYSRYGRILFAGTWLKRKGTEDLVPAFSALARRYSELSLTVLGGPTEEQVMRDFPEDIRSRVTSVITANEAENAGVYATTDIFVLPSLFEGTPLTLIEAMMSGMPIVTTATCGMKDVIDDGNTGLLVGIRSPESIIAAVDRLISDPALRAKMGRSAQERALTEHTWERAAAPVEELYQRLCERRTSLIPDLAVGAL